VRSYLSRPFRAGILLVSTSPWICEWNYGSEGRGGYQICAEERARASVRTSPLSGSQIQGEGAERRAAKEEEIAVVPEAVRGGGLVPVAVTQNRC
jgi:hypothetical protein